MVPLFERNPTELHLIFTLAFIYQRHHHRLESRNLFFVQPPYLQRYADAVLEKVHLYRIVLALFREQLLVFANEKVVWPPRKGTWCKISECGFAK